MQSSPDEAWTYLADRFDVDRDAFPHLAMVERSGDYWLVSQAATDVDAYESESEGFRAVRVQDIGLKPTTYALQFFDDAMTRNVVSVSRGELCRLLDGALIDRDADSEGYVALRWRDHIIGCGLYYNDTVSSRIPKGRGKELLRALQD